MMYVVKIGDWYVCRQSKPESIYGAISLSKDMDKARFYTKTFANRAKKAIVSKRRSTKPYERLTSHWSSDIDYIPRGEVSIIEVKMEIGINEKH